MTEAGPLFDRYELGDSLGSGVCGEVFRARVAGGPDRWYALKRCLPLMPADAVARAATAYGTLDHSRVARLIAHGDVAGIAFTVVELVEGASLDQLLGATFGANRPLPGGAGLGMVARAARAVAHAHRRGVNHLGLCPANVLASEDGEIKVSDFGLLPVRLQAAGGNILADAGLADRIAYLAPEQLGGPEAAALEPGTPATDIFALGVLAVESYTGERAFGRGTPQAVAQRIKAGAAAVAWGVMPAGLCDVVRRALAVEPSQRYASAEELADALDSAVRTTRTQGGRSDVAIAVRRLLRQRAGPAARITANLPAVKPPAQPAPPRPEPGRGTGITAPIPVRVNPPTGRASVAGRDPLPKVPVGANDVAPPVPVRAPAGPPTPFSTRPPSAPAGPPRPPPPPPPPPPARGPSQPGPWRPPSEPRAEPAEPVERVPAARRSEPRALPLPAPPLPPPSAPPERGREPTLPVMRPPRAIDSPTVTTLSPPVMQRRLLLVGGGLVVILGAYLAWHEWGPRRPRQAQEATPGTTPVVTRADAGAARTPDAASAAVVPVATVPAVAVLDASAAVPPDGSPPAAVAAPLDARPPTPPDARAPDATAAPVVTALPPSADTKLTISSTPGGATVYLDGVAAGQTPLALPAGTGKRHLVLVHPGYRLYRSDVDGGGQVAVTLEAATASKGPAGIKVMCKSRGRIYVILDGQDTGRLCPTAQKLEVVLGAHTVELYDPVTDTTTKHPVQVKGTRYSAKIFVKQ